MACACNDLGSRKVIVLLKAAYLCRFLKAIHNRHGQVRYNEGIYMTRLKVELFEACHCLFPVLSLVEYLGNEAFR